MTVVLFLLSAIPFCLAAQETGRSTILTDTIDLFPKSSGPQKSSRTAMAASLFLPGSGHHYLERNRSALAYLTADAASLFAFFLCGRSANRIARDAAGYAWLHSGARGEIKDADEYYWKLVGTFMDVNEYNDVMDLNRTPEYKIIDENLSWHWDDESSQDRYNEIRTTSRRFRIASSFFLGALVLNRVVAFIDTRSFTRRNSIRRGTLASLELVPEISSSSQTLAVSLSGSF
ncbi:MAG: hypothetical protein JXA71_00275 [Chitinispirillaceae bacterium]|nr:hypothetical protein [Chitinispirillaceae bacterium]